MSKVKIKKGDEFTFNNLSELQQFSIDNGNPKKGEFDVSLNENKKFVVVKL
ncbi:hypothetical protein [Tenacibaculum sp. Bg11-29]|uniref:hypothetical protein n=1 Tax=Tenacibaculum sp. Bg11-29 TaxID=2058306 RepID=UPI0012FEB94B|nr:hypothetical protein [Tenacibaculum sp. Bg11-29]